MNKLIPAVIFSIFIPIMFGSTQEAYAASITFEFEAEVDLVSDLGNVLGGTVNVGDSFTGTYSFDSLAPDQNANPLLGQYFPNDLSFQVGPLSYSGNALDVNFDSIFIIDGVNQDIYALNFRNMLQTSGPVLDPDDIFALNLFDNDATGVSGDSLFLSPPPLGSFEIKQVSLTSFPDGVLIRGEISSLTLQTDNVVGGQIIPTEQTSLILAGAQSFSWMIPVVLSIVGIGLILVRKK